MLEYSEYNNSINFADLSEFGTVINDSVAVLNDIFRFRDEHMSEYSIFDVLIEYANKHEYNYEYLAQELSEIPGFVDICNNDCDTFKYNYKKPLQAIHDDFN